MRCCFVLIKLSKIVMCDNMLENGICYTADRVKMCTNFLESNLEICSET